MLFTSDNWSGVHPAILEGIAGVNHGIAPAYGNDPWTKQLTGQLSELFGAPVSAHHVATGSAANALALSAMLAPYGAVIAHEHAHIGIDESGAPEFFTGGAKIIPAAGKAGKLTPETVRAAFAPYKGHPPQRVVPQVLSLTHATEAGTVYTLDDLRGLKAVARELGLKVHMDGARFANALAATGTTARDVIAASGADILTLGATKNGCLAAELVIGFDDQLTDHLARLQKRAGQVFSKNRFLAAQWLAYLKDELWLDLAAHANDMAAQLSDVFAASPHTHLALPTEINEVFVLIDQGAAERLRAAGAQFYDWVQPDDPHGGRLRRFVTNYATSAEEVALMEKTLRGL